MTLKKMIKKGPGTAVGPKRILDKEKKGTE